MENKPKNEFQLYMEKEQLDFADFSLDQIMELKGFHNDYMMWSNTEKKTLELALKNNGSVDMVNDFEKASAERMKSQQLLEQKINEFKIANNCAIQMPIK